MSYFAPRNHFFLSCRCTLFRGAKLDFSGEISQMLLLELAGKRPLIVAVESLETLDSRTSTGRFASDPLPVLVGVRVGDGSDL